MTSPEKPQSPSDSPQPNPPAVLTVTVTDAELLDEGGQVVSKGEAELARDDKVVLFYPHDRALLDTIRTRAKTLFRSDLRLGLAIAGFQDCRDQISDRVHVHVVLK